MKNIILLIVILAGCRETTPYTVTKTSLPPRLVQTEKLIGGNYDPDLYIFKDNKTEREYLIVKFGQGIAITPITLETR